MFRSKTSSHEEPTSDDGQSETKVKELREALGPLTGNDILFCTDSCLRRYLVARNWNLEKAKTMLEETLKWRAAFKPEKIYWCDVAKQGENGKLFRANFHDKYGRSVLIIRPGKETQKNLESQDKFLVYNLENAIFNLPQSQEQIMCLVDFTGFSMLRVSIKHARDCLYILQNHYPERMAMSFLYNPPWIFDTFFKMIKYFIDPITFQKIKFVYPKHGESADIMKAYFDEENLPTEFGGKATLSFDYQEFSKIMTQDDLKRDACLLGN
ncbi:unnamed protein product [Rhodiola kirilowii]